MLPEKKSYRYGIYEIQFINIPSEGGGKIKLKLIYNTVYYTPLQQF